MTIKPGMGMQRFLKLKSIREEPPESLKGVETALGGSGSFRKAAEATGGETLWIQGADYMSRCYGDAFQEEAAWFLLYCLEMNSRGHIRISARDFREDFPLWAGKAFPEARKLGENLAELIRKNPRLFAPLEEMGEEKKKAPILYGPDYSFFYLYRQRSFEKTFLELLSSFCGPAGRRFPRNEQLTALEDAALSFQKQNILFSPETLHAARLCLCSRLGIITGGPGTGKTTLLAGMLQIYLESFRRCGLPLPQVRLCAPTGRAAQRMSESLGQVFPQKAETIHKVLALRSGRLPRYRKGRELEADLLVVDEASMVDLRLMSALLEALKKEASLLLVGDRDQLPSVESGALLSDLLYRSEEPGHPLKGRVISLKKVHRSRGSLLKGASLVREGCLKGFLNFLAEQAEKGNDGRFFSKPLGVPGMLIQELCRPEAFGIQGERAFSIPSRDWKSQENTIQKYFERYRSLALLSPMRKGPWGSIAINRALDEALGGVTFQEKACYHGQPVMITRNDYEKGLFNGDRGVIFRFTNGLFAFFDQPDKGFCFYSLGLLDNFETAYAMTIHKSQGSEYEQVFLILPEGAERLLSREILYTGITRAREKLTFLYSEQALPLCLARGIRRNSGIRDFMQELTKKSRSAKMDGE